MVKKKKKSACTLAKTLVYIALKRKINGTFLILNHLTTQGDG